MNATHAEERSSEIELSDWLKAEGEVVAMLLVTPLETEELSKPNARPPAPTRSATGVKKATNGARPRVNRLSKNKDQQKNNPA